MTEHFNKLTEAEQERLAILAEEAGEVVQAAMKILRHGYASHHPNGGPSNRRLLERELGDVFFALRLMVERRDLDESRILDHMRAKQQAIKPYLHHPEGSMTQGAQEVL